VLITELHESADVFLLLVCDMVLFVPKLMVHLWQISVVQYVTGDVKYLTMPSKVVAARAGKLATGGVDPDEGTAQEETEPHRCQRHWNIRLYEQEAQLPHRNSASAAHMEGG